MIRESVLGSDPNFASKRATRADSKRQQRTISSGSDPEVLGIRISHPERVMYPDLQLTKLDVARYYEQVANAMMPHVDGRPLTLVRCGEGITGNCVYMKHSKLWKFKELTRVRIQEKTKLGEYLVIETPAAIVSLAQMDVLEIHTWNSRKDNVDRPDRIVIDLDPGKRVGWDAVVGSAMLVRRMLGTLGLESWVKTTGGRGLHIVVPLDPREGWDTCLAFARAFAGAMVRHDPDLYTTTFAKAGRDRKILIDYLRNNRTNTSIAAFSTRARTGAPVSVPIAWTELTTKLDPLAFSVLTVTQRVSRQRREPWSGYFRSRQRLSKAAVKALDGLYA